MLTPPLDYSDSGLQRTARWEGFADQAYWDALGKVWTIGYGTTRGVKEGDRITRDEALRREQEDVQYVVDAINRDSTYPLDQHEFDALVDFAYEEGVHALETSTLWRLLMSGDPADALKEFEKWDYADGHPVRGILLRRQDEAAEFALGIEGDQT
jgi:lysozyme